MNRSVSLTQLRPLIRNTSPFKVPDPPKRMTWTQSSLKQFKKCKRKWFWKYFMGMRTRRLAGALIVGSAFHNALGEWYRGKKSVMAKIAATHQTKAEDKLMNGEVDHFNQDDFDKSSYQISTLTGMLTGYSRIYQHERDQWKIHRKYIEHKFAHDMGSYDFLGMIDLYAEDRRGGFVVEHKTASRIEDSYVQRLPMDTQVRSYIYSAKRLKLEPTEVIYDVVMKTKIRRKSNETADKFNSRIGLEYRSQPNKYFFRERLKFSPKDLDSFVYEMDTVHKEYSRLIDSPDFRNPYTWITNDAMCDEYFRICEYHELCLVGLDKGTALMYRQDENMHPELAEEI